MFSWFRKLFDGVGCRQQVLEDERRTQLLDDKRFYRVMESLAEDNGRWDIAVSYRKQAERAERELEEL